MLIELNTNGVVPIDMQRSNPMSIAPTSPEQPVTWFGRNLVLAVGILLLVAFFAIPVSLDTKSHAFLHGLCAQTPSHSFVIGGKTLPFDARMTGIYLGFLIGFAALVRQGRHRSAGLPTLGSGLALLLFVGLMAVDGFNSLFTDIGQYAFYEPDNRYRIVTGFGAGLGLATVLAMLIGMSLWRKPDTRNHVLKRWWEPWLLLLPVLTSDAFSRSGTRIYLSDGRDRSDRGGGDGLYRAIDRDWCSPDPTRKHL